MASLIDCCNRALAEIAAGSISSLSDGSMESRECNRFAQALVSEISGWHEWGWQIVNVALAEVPNDRRHEWHHAYGLPSDMERPLCVRDHHCYAEGGDQISLPEGVWVDVERHRFPVRGNFPFPAQDASPVAYIIEGEALYTNARDARLHYFKVITDIGQCPPQVARAFELQLAARIALPLKKDAQLAAAINQQAELARQRAIADDINRHPRPPAIFTSDAAYARTGQSDWL
jgi:hypothetical protein